VTDYAINGAPAAASVAAADITDSTATGRALLTAANAAAQRAALGVYSAAEVDAAIAAVGGETALPRLAVSGALHHWRCDEASSPFADLGSSPVALAYVSGTREYARAGVYARHGCTLQRSPAATDRVEAVVSDIPAATDLTWGVTVANETGHTSLPVLAVVAALNNGLGAGSDFGFYLLTNSSGMLYLSVHHAAASADSSHVSIDWSRPHRLDVTYVAAIRTGTLYVDGRSAATATPASGSMGAVTHCDLGGLATAYAGVGGSSLMVADFTVHLSALSASTLLSRADVCRRLASG